MGMYELGKMIRILRTSKGLTLEQLASGICSISTLQRAETGKQMPFDYTFISIMQRLGVDIEEYTNFFMGKDDYEAHLKRQELTHLLDLCEFEKAKYLIESLESDTRFQKSVNHQYLLSSKVRFIVSISNEKIDDQQFAELMNMLSKAIKISIQDFEERNIANYLLSNEEMRIINEMAITYFAGGNIQKAIELLFELKKNIEDQYMNHREKTDLYIKILYNLSKYLGLDGRYNEAVDVCQFAISVCRKTSRTALLPSIIFNKAYALLKLEEIDECDMLLKQAYYGFVSMGDTKLADIVQTYATDNLGIVV